MIKYSLPFLLTDLSQIPSALVRENNLFLEGTIFDCKYLGDNNQRAKISNNIAMIVREYKDRLIALHFPTENANYLESIKIQKRLFDFIDLASGNGIKTIVLHSNHIQELDVFNKNELGLIRGRFDKFFRKLDRFLEGKGTIVGIENMPIIGNGGTDFDSAYVFPSDFSNFHYKNIKITWDLGHWAFTFHQANILNNISTKIKTERVDFNDFYLLKNQIHHFHFSSFRKVNLPQINFSCQEGINPVDGHFEKTILANTLKDINTWNDIYMTLEINENNYIKRTQFEKTLRWIKNLQLDSK